MNEAEPFLIWTVYDRPSDAPGEIVARLWEAYPGRTQPTNEVIRLTLAPGEEAHDRLDNMLEAIRTHAKPSFRRDFWLGRNPADDPKIMGTVL